MARRLPVYLVIDTSGSMSGEPIATVKNGIDMLVADLRNNPQALESTWLSVITFGGEAKQVVPLTSILEFECPPLTIGGEAKLGAALNLVCECQEREVRKIRKDEEGKISRGDYLPLLFVLSVGSINSEEISTGLLPFLSTKWGNSIAIFGDKSFGKLSQRLFKEAIPLGDVSEELLAAAFRWVDGTIDEVWPRPIHGAIPMAANMDLLSPGSFNEQYHRILEQVAKELFLLERPIRLLLTEGDDGPISKQITITSMHELHRVIGINPEATVEEMKEFNEFDANMVSRRKGYTPVIEQLANTAGDDLILKANASTADVHSNGEIHVAQSATGHRLYKYIWSDSPKCGTCWDVFPSPDGATVVKLVKGYHPDDNDRLSCLLRYRDSLFGKKSNLSDVQPSIVWPLDVVMDGMRFGVVESAYPKNYYFEKAGASTTDSMCGKEKVGKWFANPAFRFGRIDPTERGDFGGMLCCCGQLARAVRAIHAAGLVHGNLSWDNVLVDPVKGAVLLSGCEDAFIPDKDHPKSIGTHGFMAPEIVAMRNNPQGAQVLPNQETDRHSLAVLIYSLLLCRHPLDGAAVWDEDDAERDDALTYGENALFIEHPTDKRNRYDWNWVVEDSNKKDIPFLSPWRDLDTLPYTKLGPHLSPLVERAFVDGLHNPSARPTAAEWADAIEKTIPLNLSIPN